MRASELSSIALVAVETVALVVDMVVGEYRSDRVKCQSKGKNDKFVKRGAVSYYTSNNPPHVTDCLLLNLVNLLRAVSFLKAVNRDNGDFP